MSFLIMLLFSILKFEALDILSTSQVAQLTLESGALNSAALINMVFEHLEQGNSFQNVEEFFVTLTQTSQVRSRY